VELFAAALRASSADNHGASNLPVDNRICHGKFKYNNGGKPIGGIDKVNC